jgi:hypothetical protein
MKTQLSSTASVCRRPGLAAVVASAAALNVRPIRSGTDARADSRTVVPGGTWSPGSGHWATTTNPAGQADDTRPTETAVATAAHLLGDQETARRAYACVAPYAALPVLASRAVACLGSAHHILGVAALTFGDIDAAVEHFGEAVRRNLALGHWPATKLSQQRLAEASSARAGAGPVQDPPTGPVQCVRAGRQWQIGLGPRVVHVGHSIGMLHLAVLAANPGQEIPALEPAAGVAALHRRSETTSDQPLLDGIAVQQYQQRLAQLTADIDQIKLTDRPDRANSARSEREWLLTQLSSATGLNGRTRRFSNDAERARLAVGKAIRRAIERIDRADPYLGRHLRDSVHTGVRCSYRPRP